MSNTNIENIDFWERFQKIQTDVSQANLEDLETILDYYNEGGVLVNNRIYAININPLLAACLNARYQTLTGQDHPHFIQEQGKILDELIKSGQGISVNGQPTIYQRLKNNLTGKGLGITILPNKKGSYIDKLDQIQYNISKANLEDVTDILNYYDQDSVLINGMQYHIRPNVLKGASLNARYKELTGKDHPVFLRVQKQLLKKEMKSGQGISVNGQPTVYKLLKDNNIVIGNHHHILKRDSRVMMDVENSSLEDISSLLDHYNGKPVLIDGLVHHPFNDPVSADKLNIRYKELTGQNHPVFVEQAPKVIDRLLKDKYNLIQAGAYDVSYFHKLEEIKEEIINSSKGNNLKREDKSAQELQQMFAETPQDSSIKGRNR